MSHQHIRLDIDDAGVATVTLNRPEAMNAWTAIMAIELSDALRDLDQDPKVRAVVLTGAGKAFCAGLDMSGGGNPLTGGGQTREGAPAGATALPSFYPYHVRKPVIAAINGHAIGIGITYPVLADIRIVAEDAKIQFAFTRRGLIPELAGHAVVPRLCGMANAVELLMGGRMVSGAEAAAMGLASRALPAAEVLPAAQALARDMAINAAPAAMAASKRLLWEQMGVEMDAYIRREGKIFAWLGRQPDATEGFAAFLQKRPPAWTSQAGDAPEELFA